MKVTELRNTILAKVMLRCFQSEIWAEVSHDLCLGKLYTYPDILFQVFNELSVNRLYLHANELMYGAAILQVVYAFNISTTIALVNFPHFRLKNVVNIKAWISIFSGRTWLKRQVRQHTADEIVPTSFLIIFLQLVVIVMHSVSHVSSTLSAECIIHIEMAIWCMLSSYALLSLHVVYCVL
ncbi:hypothetical protein PsorP6_009289 [Peronosclerospora sorghi]|uniref:Uncharacterized protein n=1 Tax=Peronosclerospora sorghi TaxID=230839 RepID=A0ACC0VZN2_9STRA|nr:hypothetical protein PsorP6_009289 [Peronosclerospora sorghi]